MFSLLCRVQMTRLRRNNNTREEEVVVDHSQYVYSHTVQSGVER